MPVVVASVDVFRLILVHSKYIIPVLAAVSVATAHRPAGKGGRQE